MRSTSKKKQKKNEDEFIIVFTYNIHFKKNLFNKFNLNLMKKHFLHIHGLMWRIKFNIIYTHKHLSRFSSRTTTSVLLNFVSILTSSPCTVTHDFNRFALALVCRMHCMRGCGVYVLKCVKTIYNKKKTRKTTCFLVCSLRTNIQNIVLWSVGGLGDVSI